MIWEIELTVKTPSTLVWQSTTLGGMFDRNVEEIISLTSRKNNNV